MAICDICGETAFTNTCNECAGEYCGEHMLPENHRCESVLAEKADPSWFQDGDAAVTLGENSEKTPRNEEPDREVSELVAETEDDFADSTSKEDVSSDLSESPDTDDESDQTRQDTNDDQNEIDHQSDTVTDSGAKYGRASKSDSESKRNDSVKAVSESRLSLPDSVRRMGTRAYQLTSDVVRIGSILAVWIGVGLLIWHFISDAALMAIGRSAGTVGAGLLGVYVTTE